MSDKSTRRLKRSTSRKKNPIVFTSDVYSLKVERPLPGFTAWVAGPNGGKAEHSEPRFVLLATLNIFKHGKWNRMDQCFSKVLHALACSGSWQFARPPADPSVLHTRGKHFEFRWNMQPLSATPEFKDIQSMQISYDLSFSQPLFPESPTHMTLEAFSVCGLLTVSNSIPRLWKMEAATSASCCRVQADISQSYMWSPVRWLWAAARPSATQLETACLLTFRWEPGLRLCASSYRFIQHAAPKWVRLKIRFAACPFSSNLLCLLHRQRELPFKRGAILDGAHKWQMMMSK